MGMGMGAVVAVVESEVSVVDGLGAAGFWLNPLIVAFGVKKLERDVCFFPGGFEDPAMVNDVG